MRYVKTFRCCTNFSFTICIVCGACKEGVLIPLFTSKRKPNTPKSSRMAASKPQGIYILFLVTCITCDIQIICRLAPRTAKYDPGEEDRRTRIRVGVRYIREAGEITRVHLPGIIAGKFRGSHMQTSLSGSPIRSELCQSS